VLRFAIPPGRVLSVFSQFCGLRNGSLDVGFLIGVVEVTVHKLPSHRLQFDRSIDPVLVGVASG